MVYPHARALAFVSFSIHAGGRALLLLPVGLDHVKLAVPLQCPIDEIVEPVLRKLPIALAIDPRHRRLADLVQPLPVVLCKGEAHAKLMALLRSPDDDRNLLLTPHFP